jgi:hypothetical protein
MLENEHLTTCTVLPPVPYWNDDVYYLEKKKKKKKR